MRPRLRARALALALELECGLTELCAYNVLARTHAPRPRRERRCPGLEATATYRCCAKASGHASICAACGPAAILRASRPAASARRAAATTNRAAPAAAAGVLVSYGDGRQAVAFFLQCSSCFTPCYALAHLGLAWVLQNIIPGSRRALLSLHVREPHGSRARDQLAMPLLKIAGGSLFASARVAMAGEGRSCNALGAPALARRPVPRANLGPSTSDSAPTRNLGRRSTTSSSRPI